MHRMNNVRDLACLWS